MLRWPNTQGVMGDDPPYLVVGTEVSAKYKGAFCEAKVRKVVRSVKCKVNFKVGGSAIIADDQIRGTLRAGSVVEAKHPDRKEFIEACITKIQDCSQYTVVFDDGDITTLRRTALCLKSGRHFAESETLDQLPLTHPEHFGNPVVGNRRGGRRSRNPLSDESSEEEDEPPKGKFKEEKEADIGKVVCVELGDKKKQQKDNWFPGLVVHPAAQEVVRIRVKDEYLVRSFKDGRYFTVPKKEASEFTREIGLKVDNNTLKTAVDKALQYLDKDELPPHWDRDVIFGLEEVSTASDSDAAFESDSSDDEPREEKDHFVAQLYKFMDDRGTPINRGPVISGRDVDLYKLFKVVHTQGGYNRVTNHSQWKMVSHKVGFGRFSSTSNLVKVAYKKYLHSFEEFYRKLGCTMVNHPRSNRVRHRGGRSLIRDKDRATPIDVPCSDGKDKGSDNIDDEEEIQVKVEEGFELSADEKDEDLGKQKEIKEVDVVTKPSGPPTLERKPSDSQLKTGTPRGKPKRLADTSSSKHIVDLKKKNAVPKVKALRGVDDDNDETNSVDVEDLEDEDEDKLANTKSKVKEDVSSKPKSDTKNNPESDKKPRVIEVSEKRIKPSLTATVEKKIGRPSLTSLSEKKGKLSQDGDRKTVRSLAAEFEKKARGSEVDKKEASSSESDKRSRTYSTNDHEKKIRPSLTATLERKKSVAVESDKKSRHGDSDKKIRPSLTAEPERKKVRPSLTADPAKKVSRIDNDRKKEKAIRLADGDDTDRKSKAHDSDRKNSTSESGRSSMGDYEKKSSKSDSGDSDKRGSSKSKRGEEDKKKLYARKRKDNDDAGTTSVDDTLDLLPNYKNICIGDKLKVYYGPTHESKVTYEAKVLEVEGQGQNESYLVHYTGWNNRYDEWIKRSRIADNVSWSPARGKRRHQTPISALKKSTVKKRNITPARDGVSPMQKDQSQATSSFPAIEKSRDPQPPRSSTPSSVTSSSSRTKSPAMRPSSARVTRNMLGDTAQQPLRRTRTRRTSGQTDLPSESDSDGSGSESEMEPSTLRKGAKRQASDKDDDSIKKENSLRKKPRKREAVVEVDEDKVKIGDKEDSRDDSKDEDDVSSESPSEEKLQMKRTRKGGRGNADVKVEGEEEEVLPSASSKGMDLDLNLIRSELKGIDNKAAKAAAGEEADSECGGLPNIDMDTASLLESKASTLLEPEECTLDMEDIYEFKEPEPFEFEVRTKREPSVEPTTKLQKRPPSRIFDDVEPAIRRKVLKPNIFESESSADEGCSPIKKSFRQTLSKKDAIEIRGEDTSVSLDTDEEKASDPITPQKKLLSPKAEDAFEKLRQSPSFRLSAGSPVRAPTPPAIGSPSLLTHGLSQVSSASPSPSTSTTSVAAGLTLIKEPSQAPPPKAVTSLPKTSTTISDSTPITTPSLKYSTSFDMKSSGAVKSTQPAIVSSTSSSHPPVLAAIVKVPSESVGTKSEEWSKNKNQAPEKAETKKDDQISVKIERDESLPPLIPTNRRAPISDRSSPDPPELLPIAGLAPKIFQESPMLEVKEVQMPQIKIESSIEVEPVTSSSKTSPTAFRPETPVQDEVLSDDDSSRKSFRRKVPLKRKKAVSKEFVEDSDSDSSDAESRLVIESESSDSASETDEAPNSIQSKNSNSKWCFSGKLATVPYEEEDGKLLQKDDVLSQSKDLSSSNASEDEAMEDTSSRLKVEEAEEVEIDNNLCSLYCEETIPGSPAPPSDMPADVNIEPSSLVSSDKPLEINRTSSKVLEMPFASVPGNTRSAGPGSSSPVISSVGKLSHNDKQEVDGGGSAGGSSANPGEATPVIDNTPPLTPDSSMSTLSNSPRGEHGDSLFIVDNESMRSPRDSEDADNKENDFSDDDVDVGTRMKRLTEKREKEKSKLRSDIDSVSASPNKKRRRSGKNSENEDRMKKPRHSSSRGGGQGSDSDDNSENPTLVPATSQNQMVSGTQVQVSSAASSSSQSQTTVYVPRSKYNFLVELTPDLDASQRIAKLMHSIAELRKKYAQVKQELATIDRRRKKLRRREREARLEARQRLREERRQAREEVVN